VLSFSFEVRVRQGRVTLPCKSLRGVREPNTRFKAFAPEMLNGVPPKVVCYVRYGILQTYHILPVFFECPDWMALDVHTPSGFFDSYHDVLSFYNGYSSNGTSAYVRSFTLEKIF